MRRDHASVISTRPSGSSMKNREAESEVAGATARDGDSAGETRAPWTVSAKVAIDAVSAIRIVRTYRGIARSNSKKRSPAPVSVFQGSPGRADPRGPGH